MRWWWTFLVASCVGGPLDEASCDGLCVAVLDVSLATDSETFGLEIVDGEMSLQVSCPEETVTGAPEGSDMSVTCSPGRVSIAATAFDWPSRATFGLAGESWDLDILTTDVVVCDSVCTDGAVVLPAVR